MKYKSLTQRINEGFTNEATDWGTGEISNENDLIKAIVSASKKSVDFAKSLLKSMKSEKVDRTANVVVEATDWGTGEITSNNDLIKAAVNASKKSKELAKKILSALSDLSLKGITITESEDEDEDDVKESKKRSKKKNECGDEDEVNEDDDEDEDDVKESKKRSKKKNEDEEEDEEVNEGKKRSKKKNEDEEEDEETNEDEDEDDVSEDGDPEFSEDDVNEAVDQFGDFVELDEKAKAKLKKKVLETAGKRIGKSAKKGLSKAKGFVSSLYHDKHY